VTSFFVLSKSWSIAEEATSVEEEGHDFDFAAAGSDAEESTAAPSAGADRALTQAFAGQPPQGMAAKEHMASGGKRENSGPDGAASAKRRKQKDGGGKTKASKAPCRCRQCGHSCGRGQPHAQCHVGRGDPGQVRRAKKGGTAQRPCLEPNEVCTVLEEFCEQGFPLAKGARMPRGKKSSKK
jgi:hypothetical protein